MKSATLVFIFSAAAGFAAAAWADSNTVNNMGTPSSPDLPSTQTGRVPRKHDRPGKTKASANINGHCVITRTDTNPMPAPCSNLMIVIKDLDGTEEGRVRANSQGVFELPAERGMKYEIASGSDSYEVVAPTGPVAGGAKIDLKLHLKG